MKIPKFIAFEGLDFTGKTTQINKLSDHLTKHDIKHIITREPGGTLLGEEIRKLIFNEEFRPSDQTSFFLFLASRAEHISKIILPALHEGKIVICDRFLLSTLVYQNTIGYDKILAIHDNILNGLYPDISIVFDAKPEDIIKRKQQNMLRLNNYYDDIAFRKIHKMRDLFLQYSRSAPFKCQIVDASRGAEDVFNDIALILMPQGN